jgi:hypothetical protein
MSNYKQNIEQKTHYLQETLLPYLHNVLVAKIDVNISKINDAIVKLKDKGVDLEKIMSKALEDDVARLHEHEQAAIDSAVRKAVEDDQLKLQQVEVKAAQALQDAQQKSFFNVVHGYYQATFGKIIACMHQGIVAVQEYMHDLVHTITTYFGRKSVQQKIVADTVTEKIEENGVAHQETQHQSDAHQDHEAVQAEQDRSHVLDEQSASTDTVTSESVSQAPVVQNEQTAKSTTVVALSDVKDIKVADVKKTTSDDSHVVYRMGKAILDLFMAIIMTLYNYVVQFFTLLMKFSAYIMSGN